ncbi:unnamed protein product [Adineta steineri]|uniref:Transmembrane protein n=1 Tax=Adineta steineri TaxID=433720 RepID=A0A815B1F5_9BILA|nr:unnamed protein product [Adineta steineri]
MSTTPNNNNRFFNRIANTYIHSDSINETSTTPAPAGDGNGQSSTWVDSLIELDRVFSGTLLRLCYNLIDIVLLSLGLYYGTRICGISNALAVISILILVFSGLGLACTLLFLIRNWSLRHRALSDETSSSRYRQGYVLRALFHFFRFICICVGTGYVFTSKIPASNQCEILRFYLGTVCFNTWVLIFISPPKPSLPKRQSLIVECLMLLVVIIFNTIFLSVVASAMIKTHASECIYTRIEDLYFSVPLKSFASVGLILIACNIGISILTAILNQLFYQLPNFRRVLVHLSAVHYVISYSKMVVLVYYFSVGAVLLFRPRSGGSCRAVAPDLYKTLLIWEIISVFLPLIIWPLAFLVCCLGVAFGGCLALCFPASIIVPLLEMIEEILPNVPSADNPDPPASPGSIETLPMVVFGEVSDEFNQTQWLVKYT